MDDDDSRYTRNLGRNLIIGLIAVFIATTGLCFAAAQDLGQAAAIAVVPTLFAGPYVGLLITLISATSREAAADEHATRVLAPATSGAALTRVSDAAA